MVPTGRVPDQIDEAIAAVQHEEEAAAAQEQGVEVSMGLVFDSREGPPPPPGAERVIGIYVEGTRESFVRQVNQLRVQMQVPDDAPWLTYVCPHGAGHVWRTEADFPSANARLRCRSHPNCWAVVYQHLDLVVAQRVPQNIPPPGSGERRSPGGLVLPR